jgi:hypothetical protein
MGYDKEMDMRKATAPTPPAADGDWVEEPLDAADIAACEEAEAAIERGEWVDGEIVMAELRAMAARHRARAQLAKAKAGA